MNSNTLKRKNWNLEKHETDFTGPCNMYESGFSVCLQTCDELLKFQLWLHSSALVITKSWERRGKMADEDEKKVKVILILMSLICAVYSAHQAVSSVRAATFTSVVKTFSFSHFEKLMLN